MPPPPYRVKQTTQSAGSGAITLDPATGPFASFQSYYGTSPRRIRVAIVTTAAAEVITCDFDGGSPGTLTPVTALMSTTGGGLLALPAGSTKDVIPVPDYDQPVLAPTGSLTLTVADLGNAVAFTGTAAAVLNLPAAAAVPIGGYYDLTNAGTAIWTVDPSGAETVRGAATFTLSPGASCRLLRAPAGWVQLFSAGGSGWQLINATVVTAPTAGVTMALPPDFDRYRLEWEGLRFSINAQLIARTSTDGGATFASASGDYGTSIGYVTAGGVGGTYTLSSSVTLSLVAQQNSDVFGAVDVYPGAPQSSARFIGGSFLALNVTNTAYESGWTAGVRASSGVISAVRLMPNIGTLTAGKVSLQGRRA